MMDSVANDYKFVSEPPNEYLCPICVEPLLQPFLTECGHYLCYTCRGRLLASGKDQCPECREPNGAKDARLNKHLQRQVNSLKVRCEHNEEGCQWVGELIYLKEHLDPSRSSTRCGYILVDCPLGCGKRVRSSAMESHTRSYCSKLEFRLLPIVFRINDFLKMKEANTEWVSPPFYTHANGYKLCLVVFPNGKDLGKGSHMSVFVGLLKAKHDDQLAWPLEVDVAIELLNWRENKGNHERTVTMNSEYYRVAKNGTKISPRSSQFIHHLLLSYNRSTNTVYLQNNSVRLRVNTATIHSHSPLVVPAPFLQDSKSICEFTLTEFSKRKQLKNQFFSSFLNTHRHGYKMCLNVFANGEGSGRGTHVSVYVQILAGDNDDQLQWPFVGDIVVELVNWRKDKGHHIKTLSIGVVSGLDKVTEGTSGMAFGFHEFVSHSSLSYNRSTNTEYLHGDSLHFRIKQVAVYSTPIQLKSSSSVCEFTLYEFSKRKELNNTYYSPLFYTHQQGYKMCIEVYANGVGSGKGTHVTVYVRLIAGDNDSQLQWPFVGDINIMLLNWREDKGHFRKTVSINASSEFVRILQGMMGKTWGYHQFISHSSLAYDPASNTEYLCNDSLRLRVEQVAVYSTPFPLMVPSWQNSHCVSQSLCEFTLNEFSKRKQFNNTCCGPSFYTHQHGYKMRLKVYANGDGSGKDTHVSVYAQLMAGDNDDHLQWPFVGDIEFVLLNWREDKRHYKKSVSIDRFDGLVRVLEGDYGKCLGRSQFILHSSLHYNRSTNTEYLLNDSLRLQVKKVAVYSTPLSPDSLLTPSWQDPRIAYQSVCEFTLKNFLKRKQFNNIFYSPPFYSHYKGYKMCLKVFANGEGDGEDVSVFVTIMSGDNDEQLQWPFAGVVELMLLNWIEDKGHHEKTLNINASSGLVRVIEGDLGKNWGYSQFISHSSLRYNRSTNTEYLRNDSLRFRVKQVTVYSTPLLLKTPTWQNPRHFYQSVFECTVNEFSKRKHFANCFTSAPFYTHPRGYKMCLVVHANGFGNGKNTHVSVFVQIMAGEYDDRLRWPFVGDISIMLLNWRENRRFVFKTMYVRVPNRMVRVVEGKEGLVWGFHTFISHSSLRYDRSTNTEYLQDDCLRFRIYKIDVKGGCAVM